MSSGSRSQLASATIVLAALAGLVCVFAGTLLVATRSYVGGVSTLADEAKVRYLADGGANLAIRQIIQLQRQSEAPDNPLVRRTSYQCGLADGSWLAVSAASELSKIDINSANPRFLRALFVGLGATPATANAVVDRVGDYLDTDDTTRTDGAEAETYAAAGLAWRPRNGRMDTVDELAAVWGLPYELVQRAMPHLTVFTAASVPDLAHMPAQRRAILRRGGLAVPGDDGATTPGLRLRPDRDVVAIDVMAVLASGTRFARNVIIELDISGRAGFRIRRWRGGGSETAAAIAKEADQSPCL